jgi:uncharacterized membrane protein YdjX (TVP38/TMEM64 family)
MNIESDPSSSRIASGRRQFPLRRLAPLAAIGVVSIAVIAMGWHRELSFETLARHHEALRLFIAAHEAIAVASYVALYIGLVALSLPIGAYLTVIGGILFGAVLGGMAAVIGASIGAIVIFSIARSAFSENALGRVLLKILLFLTAKSALGQYIARRIAGATEKIVEQFRQDAFSYLLFLRLVPVFPFWLVNLVAAAAGVRLAQFVKATVLGIIPASFVFASVGNGLESVIVAQGASYRACVAAGGTDCPLVSANLLTPELLVALVALGLLALVPVMVKRWRARDTNPVSRI